MSTSNLFRCKPNAILLSEGKAPSSVQLLRTGTFHHAKYGTFEITPVTLSTMVTNFKNGVRGIDLAIDYAHNSELDAAGWVKELELKEDGNQLWARVEWTPKGTNVVLGQEYRYLSADFTFAYVDNETKKQYGATLLGAGLTNRPVIKNMAPVELSEGEMKMDKDKMIAELQAKVAELQTALEAKAPVGNEEELAELKKKCAEYEASEKAAKELAAKAETEKKLAEQKESFTRLLSEGKAVEAQRESFMSGDMAKFASLAQPLNLSEKGHGNAPAPVKKDANKTAGETILTLAEAKAKAEKIGLAEAIKKVRTENAELNNQYLNEVKV